jgi:hypothetical protein
MLPKLMAIELYALFPLDRTVISLENHYLEAVTLVLMPPYNTTGELFR